jgi:FkbM family methyltransferase
MQSKTAKIGKYSITYFNEIEFKTLREEIFRKNIYATGIDFEEEVKIIDVGSYIGLSILYFKSQFPNSIIVGFEPNPNVFPLLEDNIYQNNLKDVVLHNIAIGKEEKVRKFYIESSGNLAFSTASFKKDAWNGKQKSRPISVRTEKLSKYIKDEIDLLKIDTEGAEQEILQELDINGSLKLIRNLIIEYHPIKKGGIEKISKLLKKNNFKVSYLKEGKELKDPKEDLILVVAKKSI